MPDALGGHLEGTWSAIGEHVRVPVPAGRSEGMRAAGGSGEIRTHGGRKTPAVFKTAAFNRSATLP